MLWIKNKAASFERVVRVCDPTKYLLCIQNVDFFVWEYPNSRKRSEMLNRMWFVFRLVYALKYTHTYQANWIYASKYQKLIGTEWTQFTSVGFINHVGGNERTICQAERKLFSLFSVQRVSQKFNLNNFRKHKMIFNKKYHVRTSWRKHKSSVLYLSIKCDIYSFFPVRLGELRKIFRKLVLKQLSTFVD